MTENLQTTHTFSGLPREELSQIVDLLVRNSCDHALIEIDVGGTVLSVSESFYRIFGRTEADAIGKSLTHFYPGNQQNPERMTRLISSALSDGRGWEEENYQRGGGQIFCAETTVFPVSGSDPLRFVLIVRDVTLLVASQEQLHVLMTIDELTGLNNRQHVFDLGRVEYRRWERYNSPLSIVLCEVAVSGMEEEQKYEALRDMADILRQCLREVDTPAHIHDGVFCVLMFSTPLEGASVVAERIRRAVKSTGFKLHHASNLKVNLVVNTAGPLYEDFDRFYEQTFSSLQSVRRQGDDHLIVL